MTSDRLRELLDYPDGHLRVPDPVTIARVARQQRRRRLAWVAPPVAAAVLAAAAVVWLAPGSDQVAEPTPPAVSASGSPTGSPAPAPSSATNAVTPTVTRAAPGERVDMGHGWRVWLRGDSVCRSVAAGPDEPADRATPFDCTSTTEGNVGGMNLQGFAQPGGTMVSAAIPYDAARVDVVVVGEPEPADLVRFEGLPGWTFYYLFVPEERIPDGPESATAIGAVAYDADGGRLAGSPGT